MEASLFSYPTSCSDGSPNLPELMRGAHGEKSEGSPIMLAELILVELCTWIQPSASTLEGNADEHPEAHHVMLIIIIITIQTAQHIVSLSNRTAPLLTVVGGNLTAKCSSLLKDSLYIINMMSGRKVLHAFPHFLCIWIWWFGQGAFSNIQPTVLLPRNSFTTWIGTAWNCLSGEVVDMC